MPAARLRRRGSRSYRISCIGRAARKPSNVHRLVRCWSGQTAVERCGSTLTGAPLGVRSTWRASFGEGTEIRGAGNMVTLLIWGGLAESLAASIYAGWHPAAPLPIGWPTSSAPFTNSWCGSAHVKDACSRSWWCVFSVRHVGPRRTTSYMVLARLLFAFFPPSARGPLARPSLDSLKLLLCMPGPASCLCTVAHTNRPALFVSRPLFQVSRGPKLGANQDCSTMP